MIFKVGHLALSSGLSISTLTGFFEESGYSTEFSAMRSPTTAPPQFFEKFRDQNDIALLSIRDSYSVEILNHHGLTERSSSLTPILNSVDPTQITEKEQVVIGGRKFISGLFSPLDIRVYARRESANSKFRFTDAVVPASKINRSAEFWQQLGFKLVEADSGSAYLKFGALPPFVPNELGFLLVKREPAQIKWKCDQLGFTFIALVSNDVDADHKGYSAIGMNPTPIQSEVLNGKRLRMFFLSGPDGEIVEVYGVDR